MDTTIKIPTELQGAGIPAVLQDELPTLRQGGRIGLFTAIWSLELADVLESMMPY
ncbi:MAG: hypothetical protein LBG59_08540 [Candidatus Peribacteria bacterium]|nr:hypothetical protein [Candidatus Peribacteria bacterium]